MYCPLMNDNCKYEYCGFHDKEKNQCSVITLSRNIESLTKEIKDRGRIVFTQEVK